MAGLPRNIFVADLVEVMEAKAAAGIGGVAAEKGDEVEEDGGVVCDLCDDGEKKPAAIHCPTCGFFLCDSHQRTHGKLGATKTHTVVTMEEYKKGAAGDGESLGGQIYISICMLHEDRMKIISLVHENIYPRTKNRQE